MTGVWALAALWLALALVASLLSIWLKISTALSEIVVGTIAQLLIGAMIGPAVLGTDESWVKFLSGIGAIVLTFLAGAELDPVVFRQQWKEAAAIGFASFLLPFLCCAAAAHYLLGWQVMPSWLAESRRGKFPVARSASRARRSPARAMASRRVRLDLTSANSAATKKALRASRTTMATTRVNTDSKLT